MRLGKKPANLLVAGTACTLILLLWGGKRALNRRDVDDFKREPTITVLTPLEAVRLPTRPKVELPQVDTGAFQRGARIYGIVDATQWNDSVLVLDRFGLVWIIGPGAGPVRRVISLEQSTGKEVDDPLSIVANDEGFGAWDVSSRTLYWIPENAPAKEKAVLLVDPADLFLAASRPFEPPRLHGRLVDTGSSLILEVRTGSFDATGPMVDAAVIRFQGRELDTLFTFLAPSMAERRGDLWVCCRRAPLFSPQPWWSLLSDGDFVFSDGIRREISVLSTEGATLRQVTWEPGHRDRALSKRDFVRYRQEDIHRTFAHAPRGRVRSLEKEAVRRVERFPGAQSNVVPSLTQLLVDDEDRVWVRRFDREHWPEGLSDTWDVFDSGLHYLGWVQLPVLDHVFEIREGHVLGAAIVHDELQQVILVPIVDQIGSS